MSPSHFVILYVANVSASVEFYQRLLGRDPLEASPGFALFALTDGVMLGLWLRSAVLPTVQSAPGANELAFVAKSPQEVQDMHARLVKHSVQVVQAPTQMDFGLCTTAVDPDGHRLRWFCPA